ncbi:MAG: Gfo/Idh/MocA family oxidoreductase [Armatimonadetes bacterium]|nr:Gfo/Idh/MocA family oxidoreductase [Armatimonadota bacterium]
MSDSLTLRGAGQAAVLAAATAAARAQAAPLGVGLVGLGRRGLQRLAQLAACADARLVAACDVDETTWATAPAGIKPQADLHRLLADPTVKAVIIAVPTHWTALATLMALRAGKDVLVEPPVCWSFAEGERLLEAAKASGRIVAVGHDNRTAAAVRGGVVRAQSRVVGAVHTARAICYRPYVPTVATRDAAPPKTLHWPQWQGPVGKLAFNIGLLSGGWTHYGALGHGELGDGALDPLDSARWLLGGADLPIAVHSSGGRFGKDVPGDTPNVQHAVFTLADKRSLAVEVRGLPSPDEVGLRVGAMAYGATGWLTEADGFEPHLDYDGKGKAPEGLPQVKLPGAGGSDVVANFAAAVRANAPADVNCPLLAGVRTAQYIALAGISLKLGRALRFDPAAGRFVDAPDADKLLARPSYAAGYSLPA